MARIGRPEFLEKMVQFNGCLKEHATTTEPAMILYAYESANSSRNNPVYRTVDTSKTIGSSMNFNAEQTGIQARNDQGGNDAGDATSDDGELRVVKPATIPDSN